jgi:hypothetical protein
VTATNPQDAYTQSLNSGFNTTAAQLGAAGASNPAASMVFNQSSIPGGAAGLGLNTSPGQIWGSGQQAAAQGQVGNMMGAGTAAVSGLPPAIANIISQYMPGLAAKVNLNTGRAGSLAQNQFDLASQQTTSQRLNQLLGLGVKQAGIGMDASQNQNALAAAGMSGLQTA